jgi:hypothetical protein
MLTFAIGPVRGELTDLGAPVASMITTPHGHEISVHTPWRLKSSTPCSEHPNSGGRQSTLIPG